MHGQNVGGQNTGGTKRQSKLQGGGGGDKMLSILWDREGKMPILTKHFIFDTDGQAN